MKQKPLNSKDPNSPMTLLEAEKYLRNIKEWDGVTTMERDTIIKWAEYLKNLEIKNEKTTSTNR